MNLFISFGLCLIRYISYLPVSRLVTNNADRYTISIRQTSKGVSSQFENSFKHNIFIIYIFNQLNHEYHFLKKKRIKNRINALSCWWFTIDRNIFYNTCTTIKTFGSISTLLHCVSRQPKPALTTSGSLLWIHWMYLSLDTSLQEEASSHLGISEAM